MAGRRAGGQARGRRQGHPADRAAPGRRSSSTTPASEWQTTKDLPPGAGLAPCTTRTTTATSTTRGCHRGRVRRATQRMASRPNIDVRLDTDFFDDCRSSPTWCTPSHRTRVPWTAASTTPRVTCPRRTIEPGGRGPGHRGLPGHLRDELP
ncbi:hypothetical protein QJS66_22820 [Kocuria rhizophila]|nr:hypothetical protein QJS66_22820 [Kocuria rhizophila]